jgi:hypothetical protein
MPRYFDLSHRFGASLISLSLCSVLRKLIGGIEDAFHSYNRGVLVSGQPPKQVIEISEYQRAVVLTVS